MPVRSANEVIETAVREYLEEKVPEDTTATFTVSPLSIAYFPCEHEKEEMGVPEEAIVVDNEVVWRISVLLTHPVPGAEGPRRVRYAATMPFTALDDGENDGLVEILDQMWTDQQFSQMMIDGEMDDALEQVTRESGDG